MSATRIADIRTANVLFRLTDNQNKSCILQRPARHQLIVWATPDTNDTKPKRGDIRTIPSACRTGLKMSIGMTVTDCLKMRRGKENEQTNDTGGNRTCPANLRQACFWGGVQQRWVARPMQIGHRKAARELAGCAADKI